MFDDAQEADGVQRTGAAFGKVRKDHPEARLDLPATIGGTVDASELDSPNNHQLHARLLSYYEQELDRQSDNRLHQAGDEDFYDNIQWDEADARVLRGRGQVPLVYNVIASAVNWVIGTEKRGRSDYKILPRRKDAAQSAERKSELMKYLSDVNSSQFHKSRAFEDAVKVGVGWIETGVQDDADGEPVYTRYESWRNMLWDSASTEKDLTDCRYIIRSKWVDLDIAQALFPKRAYELQLASNDADRFRGADLIHGDEAMDAIEDLLDSFGGPNDLRTFKRRRVRLIECWYRKPMPKQRLRGGEHSGDVYEEGNPAHEEAIETGTSVAVERTMYRMHCAVFSTRDMLYVGETPYRHNSFPFTPIWCYRRGRDGMPYGLIRGMKDIQADINKRASKALAILSSNKTIMDEGAVEDLKAYAEEVARPDAIIVKKSGKELIINAERDLAAPHLDLMSRSISLLQSQSGVTDEAMGRTTNAVAGIAIQRRQEQAGMATAGIFDNLRFANQKHGEKELSLIEQYFSEEKQFRITNQRGVPTFITINDGLPQNDITRTKADFVISEEDARPTIRQAQAESLLEVLKQLAPVAPQVALVMLDLVVEHMDIPDAEEIASRIRKVTGMRAPDAPEQPTPEEMQAMAEKQKQQQMQEADIQATIADKQAGAMLKTAQADKAKGDLHKLLSSIAGDNVNTQKAALEAALAAISAPPAVPVADAILMESGFVSKSQQDAQNRDQAMAEAMKAAQDEMAQGQAQQQQQAVMQQAGAVQQIDKATEHMPPIHRQAAQQQLAEQAQAAQQQPPQAGAGAPQ